jgi:hypothetical protein
MNKQTPYNEQNRTGKKNFCQLLQLSAFGVNAFAHELGLSVDQDLKVALPLRTEWDASNLPVAPLRAHDGPGLEIRKSLKRF